MAKTKKPANAGNIARYVRLADLSHNHKAASLSTLLQPSAGKSYSELVFAANTTFSIFWASHPSRTISIAPPGYLPSIATLLGPRTGSLGEEPKKSSHSALFGKARNDKKRKKGQANGIASCAKHHPSYPRPALTRASSIPLLFLFLCPSISQRLGD